MARRPESWSSGVRIACGLALGFASACHDIVALDCSRAGRWRETNPTVSDACTPADTGGTSVSGDVDTGAEDPTGVADTGSLCGNGVVDPGEECDDGDLIDIDECDNECRAPVCGNGIVQPGEDCDLGIANDDHGSCKLDCTAAICGDGIVRWGVESCDGSDTDGFSCEAFGYVGGELLCDAGCVFDLSLCTFCPDGGDTCDAYQPCDAFCESGASCWSEYGFIGTCLPSCAMPDECPPADGFAAECWGEMCLIPCEEPCPRGMLCQPSVLYPGMVCLW